MKRFAGLALIVAIAALPTFGQVGETATPFGAARVDFRTGKMTWDAAGPRQPTVPGDVYNNTTLPGGGNPGTANTGFSSTDPLNCVWGDQIQTLGAGTLSQQTFSLFNSTSSGNTGTIDQVIVTLKFYNNVTPGTLPGQGANTLIGQYDSPVIDFTNGGTQAGLAAGFYTELTIENLDSLLINLPSNLIITQEVTPDNFNGTSIRFGVVSALPLLAGTSSPNTIYITNSPTNGVTQPGFYTFTGIAAQLDSELLVVPEPATMALLGLGLAALARRRR